MKETMVLYSSASGVMVKDLEIVLNDEPGSIQRLPRGVDIVMPVLSPFEQGGNCVSCGAPVIAKQCAYCARIHADRKEDR